MTVGFQTPWAVQATAEASDGYRLGYRRWNPASMAAAGGTPRPTVVLLNGIMSNSRWFTPLVAPLTEAGFTLIGADRRGSGPNRSQWGDAPSAKQLVEDVVTIVEHAAVSGPILLVGWCWGAALAVAVAHRLRSRVAGLALVTPGMFPTAAIRDAMAAQTEVLAAADPSEAVIDSPIREEWFTTGPALDAFVRRDPDRVLRITPRMVEVSTKLSTAAVARLRTLATPLLVVLAEHDEATDNAATHTALAGLPADRVDVVTVPSHHGMQFDAPEVLARTLIAFAERVLPSPS